MTVRAFILGLVGGLLIAALGHINDEFMHLSRLVGHFFPISVFGMVLLVALTVNPLLFLLRPAWRLRSAELATVVAIMLVCCGIPGGLMQSFTPTLALPSHLNRLLPGWRKHGLMEYVNPAMLPAGGKYDPAVTDEVMTGMRGVEGSIAAGDVPWEAWRLPMGLWGAIIVLCALAVVGLGLVVHRQWSAHERLRYPIAEVAHWFMDQQPGRAMGGVFRNRWFWWGAGIVLFIRGINYISAWYPGFISIPLQWDVMRLGQVWPDVWQVPLTWLLLYPKLYPSIVAFAFLLASDVSFSLGIAHWIFVVVATLLVTHGVDISHDLMTGKPMGWQIFGSYLGLAGIVAYTGRRYYGQVLVRALVGRRRGRGQDVHPPAVWGCRLFLAASAGLAALLTALGLQWPRAILTVLLLMLMYLGIARVTAESGLIFLQSYWLPTGILIGLFGAEVLGPKAIILSGMVATILAINPKECLLPFVVNGLKIGDSFGASPGRVGGAGAIVFVLALAVAMPVVIWANYNWGLPRLDLTGQLPGRRPFEAAEPVVSKLTTYGELDKVNSMGPLERLASIRPERKFLTAAGVGVALMVGFSAMRLRFTWWPFHPFMFLVWGTWAMGYFGPSFLLGWMIKTVAVRFGGGRMYERLKPFMIGAVAGDLLSGSMSMGVAAVYYFATGSFAPGYRIYP